MRPPPCQLRAKHSYLLSSSCGFGTALLSALGDVWQGEGRGPSGAADLPHATSRIHQLTGGAATGLPFAARAQQRERMRRIGVLLPGTANDLEFQTRLGAFVQALALLGWDIGRNVSIDTRWATSNSAELDRHARELAALAPDVILANGSAAAAPLLQATRTVPIVFAIAADPVGAGLVDSLARPGGNATGFITFEYGISAKWLELLKEIAPGVKQVAVFRDPDLALGAGQFGAIQSVAPSFGVEVRPVDVRDAPAIERAITGFASTANGGLIVTGSAAAVVHRALIVRLAAQQTAVFSRGRRRSARRFVRLRAHRADNGRRNWTHLGVPS